MTLMRTGNLTTKGTSTHIRNPMVECKGQHIEENIVGTYHVSRMGPGTLAGGCVMSRRSAGDTVITNYQCMHVFRV